MISRPFKYADCSSEMRFCKEDFNRCVNSFIKTLLTKVHKLIGRKSENDCGLLFFGTRTIHVLDKPRGIGTPEKKSCVASKKSCAIIS